MKNVICEQTSVAVNAMRRCSRGETRARSCSRSVTRAIEFGRDLVASILHCPAEADVIGPSICPLLRPIWVREVGKQMIISHKAYLQIS